MLSVDRFQDPTDALEEEAGGVHSLNASRQSRSFLFVGFEQIPTLLSLIKCVSLIASITPSRIARSRFGDQAIRILLMPD